MAQRALGENQSDVLFSQRTFQALPTARKLTLPAKIEVSLKFRQFSHRPASFVLYAADRALISCSANSEGSK
jgi:hypothetical protein